MQGIWDAASRGTAIGAMADTDAISGRVMPWVSPVYGGWLSDPRDADVAGVMENAEGEQQPDHDANDHDGVEDGFYLSVHRDVVVDEPEQHADDDQGDGEIQKWHR